MSLRYLPEHAHDALLALDLARKEAKHLRYSQSTLFALPIDLAWVQALGNRPDLAEKVEAFVSRFGKHARCFLPSLKKPKLKSCAWV
jgi:hypothetical protein